MSLEVIREGVQFRPDAAASFRRMEAAQGRQVDTNRTVVPYSEQADLYAQYKAGNYPYKVVSPDISNHVYRSDSDGGNAMDTDERGDWLDDHGWIAEYADEPWHREYHLDRDNHRNDPINTSEEDEDMPIIMHTPKGDYYVVDHGAGTYRNICAGMDSVSNAFAYRDWLKNQGVKEITDAQPANLLAGYTNVTDQGTIKDEVAKGVAEALAAA